LIKTVKLKDPQVSTAGKWNFAGETIVYAVNRREKIAKEKNYRLLE